MACIGMADMAMAYIVMAYVVMAADCIGMVYAVVALHAKPARTSARRSRRACNPALGARYVGMANVSMPYTVMAYKVMAHTVTA